VSPPCKTVGYWTRSSKEALITAAVTGEIDADTFDNDRNME